MADPASYRPRPGSIPTDPGVYRFFDAFGNVVYVGLEEEHGSHSAYLQGLRSQREYSSKTWLPPGCTSDIASRTQHLQASDYVLSGTADGWNLCFSDDGRNYAYAERSDSGRFRALIPDSLRLRNRAISERYAPGSTFKILTTIALIENDLADPATTPLPFLTAHKKALAAKEAETSYQQSLASYRQTLYRALGETQNAILNLAQSQKEAQNLQERLAQAKDIEALTRIRYQAGAASLQDVLEKDNGKHIAWQEKAAEKIAYTAYLTGEGYETGLEGFPVDCEKAKHWYQKAHDMGMKFSWPPNRDLCAPKNKPE